MENYFKGILNLKMPNFNFNYISVLSFSHTSPVTCPLPECMEMYYMETMEHKLNEFEKHRVKGKTYQKLIITPIATIFSKVAETNAPNVSTCGKGILKG